MNDGNIRSNANDEYLLCWQNGSEENLTAINLKNGEAIDCDIQLKDPSMTTIGDYFPIEDENKNQYYAVVEGDQIKVEKLEMPEEQQYKLPLSYSFSTGKNSAILVSGNWDEKKRILHPKVEIKKEGEAVEIIRGLIFRCLTLPLLHPLLQRFNWMRSLSGATFFQW